jgi:prepilin-type N-terminal cleavage/methylation domain-containing protein
MIKTMNQKISNRKKAGFTLLEILVVISIIGILVAMGAVAYSTAQKKGRDARRQADIKAIQSAQEQYYAANSSVYATTQDVLVTAGFLQAVLVDPKSSPYSLTVGGSNSLYCICSTALESTTGNGSGGSGGVCTFTAAGTRFCAKNLQ